jgi:phospholipid transport system substrate-binding protein
MRMHRWLVAVLVAALLLPAAAAAAKPKPAETIRKYVEIVLQELKKTQVGEDGEMDPEVERRLQKLAEDIFDFRLMARMSLAANWNDFNEEQQKEFVTLFKDLLQQNYFDKIGKYIQEIKKQTADSVVIKGQTVFSERKAEVRTVINYQDKDVPVKYRLVSYPDKGWMVYDIYVEGVSLVQNYRSQFKDLMLRNSPGELLETLRDKVSGNGGAKQSMMFPQGDARQLCVGAMQGLGRCQERNDLP